MKFIIALQFLFMLFMSAPPVNATCCLGAEFIGYRSLACGLEPTSPTTLIPYSRCVLVDNFNSFRGNLKATCLPPRFKECFLEAHFLNDCRGDPLARLTVSPLTGSDGCGRIFTSGGAHGVRLICKDSDGQDIEPPVGPCTCSGAADSSLINSAEGISGGLSLSEKPVEESSLAET